MKNISWNYLVNTAPDIIRNILEGLKDYKDNPKYHPEKNAYDHIKTVTERLIKTGDMDLVMAGFFHDLGKISTGSPSDEGNWNTSHGHEKDSSKLVLRYKDWIQELGGNPYVVYEIVKNHMKIKFDAIDKRDKERLERYTIFQKLSMFTNADNMNRKWDLDEGLNLPKKDLNTPEKWFKDLLRQMEPRKFEKRQNSIFYIIDNDVYMEQDLKTGYLWVNYNKIWSIFDSEFDIGYGQIQDLIKGMVEEHFKTGSLTPGRGYKLGFYQVEKHFKTGSLTPVYRTGRFHGEGGRTFQNGFINT